MCSHTWPVKLILILTDLSPVQDVDAKSDLEINVLCMMQHSERLFWTLYAAELERKETDPVIYFIRQLCMSSLSDLKLQH